MEIFKRRSLTGPGRRAQQVYEIMKGQISAIERRILAVLQEGLPKSQTPYKDMAERVGIETEQLLRILADWKQQGKLRRIGAIVNHFRLGPGYGAMVVWRVEPERVEQTGRILAGFEQVSHAYQREARKNWPYNIYTMVHGADAKQLQCTIKQMSRACGVTEYRVLVTEKELKKTPPAYVTQ